MLEGKPAVALVGTCDSKLCELLRLRQLILDSGTVSVILIDVGRSSVSNAAIAISQEEVLRHAPAEQKRAQTSDLPRGELIKHMTLCAVNCVQSLHSQGKLCGIVSVGGSGGTSLVAPVMRSLPIGLPKLMVSTVASGDTGPLVGETDITMMYSVVDIAGSNALLERIFSNAAAAIAGMAKAYASSQSPAHTVSRGDKQRRRVGITMFGVTTPCADAARAVLEKEHNCEVYVFHATGHGGMAMERLVATGQLDAVLDITTTEIADHLMGGNMSAGPDRLSAALTAGIPYVLSLGATDMVNFGPRAMVPEKYQDRQLYEHNPTVTLMRTTKEECRKIGQFLVDKIRSCAKIPSKVKVVLPMGGVSLLAVPGGPFENQDADTATFETVERGLEGTEVQVIQDRRAINDRSFAEDIAQRLAQLL